MTKHTANIVKKQTNAPPSDKKENCGLMKPEMNCLAVTESAMSGIQAQLIKHLTLPHSEAMRRPQCC